METSQFKYRIFSCFSFCSPVNQSTLTLFFFFGYPWAGTKQRKKLKWPSARAQPAAALLICPLLWNPARQCNFLQLLDKWNWQKFSPTTFGRVRETYFSTSRIRQHEYYCSSGIRARTCVALSISEWTGSVVHGAMCSSSSSKTD